VVIAHRGASAVAPENTAVAYRRAAALGAVAAETDVRLSVDGHIIAIHDATVDRTTDGSGAVADLTWPELQKLDAGSWHGADFRAEGVPDLSAVLDAVGEQMVLCVEIKAGRGIERALEAALDGHPARDRVVFFAFGRHRLRIAGEQMPDIPRLLLIKRVPDEPLPALLEHARTARAAAVGMDHRGLSQGWVDQAHAAGMAVFVYTVDEPADVARVVALGVDGIIANAPDRVSALLAQRSGGSTLR